MRISAYKVAFFVPGLTSATAAKIEQALRSLAGVTRVATDVLRGRVDVVYAPDAVSRQDLSKAIAATGVTGVRRC